MKSRTLTRITAITLFAALALPLQLAAQHTRYKLIDIGTFGGPTSYFSAGDVGERVLNNRGMLAGAADTATPDSDCLNGGDCFVTHAFRWQAGVLTDLGTLPGGNFSLASAINARGWISGTSTNGKFDPFVPPSGGFVNRAVLWKGDQISIWARWVLDSKARHSTPITAARWSDSPRSIRLPIPSPFLADRYIRSSGRTES